MRATMRVIGLAGWSGAGKTTLVARLIGELRRRGHTVSTLKHAHHDFEVDRPGKDSYEHRAAGAAQVLVGSANRWALMTELRGAPEPGLRDLLRRLDPVDFVIVEGFKRAEFPKIEVYRADNGKPALFREVQGVRAVAADVAFADCPLPQVGLDDIAAIADLVERFAVPMDDLLGPPRAAESG
jgi:molybdopterin-guanine dinucleotide biosynthesis protein B